MIRTAAERWTPRLRRLQVAAKYMPAGSKIIGVDLVPIRAIRNVVTIAQDITTQKCYAQLNKELDGRAVDLVRAAPPRAEPQAPRAHACLAPRRCCATARRMSGLRGRRMPTRSRS